jgi:hypothetical protein
MKQKANSLLVVAALLFLSLIAAYVLFHTLESAANINDKRITLGGAIAGFLAVFTLLRATYFRLEKHSSSLDELEQQVRRVMAEQLTGFVVPEGYKAEISAQFGFGFCYPAHWKFQRFPGMVPYGFSLDPDSAHAVGFARNVNVMIDDISNDEREIHAILEACAMQARLVLKDASLVEQADFLHYGLPASRQVVEYTGPDGSQLTLYQVRLADRNQQNLFTISCTSKASDFLQAKGEFDSIVSTFRLK